MYIYIYIYVHIYIYMYIYVYIYTLNPGTKKKKCFHHSRFHWAPETQKEPRNWGFLAQLDIWVTRFCGMSCSGYKLVFKPNEL